MKGESTGRYALYHRLYLLRIPPITVERHSINHTVLCGDRRTSYVSSRTWDRQPNVLTLAVLAVRLSASRAINLGSQRGQQGSKRSYKKRGLLRIAWPSIRFRRFLSLVALSERSPLPATGAKNSAMQPLQPHSISTSRNIDFERTIRGSKASGSRRGFVQFANKAPIALP